MSLAVFHVSGWAIIFSGKGQVSGYLESRRLYSIWVLCKFCNLFWSYDWLALNICKFYNLFWSYDWLALNI